MKRIDLITKIKQRRTELNISLENLAILSGLGYRTVTRLLAGDDVKLSSVEQITKVLGLDFAGNEEVDIQTLREQRAEKKALYIVGLVQDTMSLEKQGLEKEAIDDLLKKTKEQFLTGEHKDKLWST